MNIDNIEGGVSPIKARQASRGEKSARKATATGKRRGGFAKSKGKRGGGGRNVGGYNVQTRFRPEKAWIKPPSGGTSVSAPPNPIKPYSVDNKGDIIYNNNITQNTEGGYNITETPGYWEDYYTEHKYPDNDYSYQAVWDRNADNFQDLWVDKDQDGDGGYAAWEKAAKKWNEENPGKSKEIQQNNKGKTYKVRHQRWIPGTTTQTYVPGGSNTATINN